MILKQNKFNGMVMFIEWKKEIVKRSYEMASTGKKKMR